MIITILTILILLLTHLLPRKIRIKVLYNLRRCANAVKRFFLYLCRPNQTDETI